MATRQYIGARYVPLFMGNYDPATIYEPLSIVIYNNATYTSKKEVPVGILPTDTTYWALTGNFNGYISALDTKIDTEIIARKELETKVNGDVIVISDSYGIDYPATTEGKTFFDYMHEISGWDNTKLRCFAYSSCGFVNNTGGGTFLDLFIADSANISDKENIGTILVAAGRNDWVAPEDNILNAIRGFVNYCQATYPNATVKIAYIGNGNNTAATGTRTQQMIAYYAFARCAEAGAYFIQGAEAILKNTKCMAADFAHPNDYGRRRLAEYLLQGLALGSCHVNYPGINVSYTLDTSQTMVTQIFRGAGIVRSWMTDGIIYIRPTFNDGALSLNNYIRGIYDHSGVYQKYAELDPASNAYMVYPFDKVILPFTGFLMDSNIHEIDYPTRAGLSINDSGELSVFLYEAAVPTNAATIATLTGTGCIAIPAAYA